MNIVTAGDMRDQRARADAKQAHRERRQAIAAAQMKLAGANERYEIFGGSLRRLARMKAAKALRELESA